MSNIVEVLVLVEGQTERVFVERILKPYIKELTKQRVFVTAVKPKMGYGNVRFERYKRDIGIKLKQPNTYITLMVDYYGIGDWIGLKESERQPTHTQKAEVINNATAQEVQRLFPKQSHRFVPYVSMHEIEALWFSNPAVLAQETAIKLADLEAILNKCGEPEAINDDPKTAPSKRLMKLSKIPYDKIATGMAIAKAIGIPQMRKQCPLFDAWIKQLENLKA
jgi:hypothetical protein